MNKRGSGIDIQGLLLVQLLIGIAVAGLIIAAAANPDAFSNINKFYAQEDISMIIEAMLASPGDTSYSYDIKKTFDVTVTEQVLVSRSPSFTDGFVTYTLLLEKNMGENTVSITKQDE
jgi:hypothetical protein